MAEILVNKPKNNPSPIKINPQVFIKSTIANKLGFNASDLKKSENIQVDSNKKKQQTSLY